MLVFHTSKALLDVPMVTHELTIFRDGSMGRRRQAILVFYAVRITVAVHENNVARRAEVNGLRQQGLAKFQEQHNNKQNQAEFENPESTLRCHAHV